MSNSYRDVIKKAREQENQKESMPDNQKEPDVNLSIRVPKALRRHWASEAKRLDTTLTAVIIEALKARFGEPPTL